MKGEHKSAAYSSKPLTAADVPESFQSEFIKAQSYVERYFLHKEENPRQGLIDICGERYILIRAASMSKEFFDLITSLHQDRGEAHARTIASGFLFDMAHAIGKADASSFYSKMGVTDPIGKLSAGPIHFAYTGWAFVKIFPESNPTPDENYYLIYDHPFSFEADTWLKSVEKTNFPVCIMNAGYSSGWCEESFGVPLVAVEVECRAKGDEHCRFIMAPPSKIEGYITRYSYRSTGLAMDSGSINIPEFFLQKRLEDELLKNEDSIRALLNTPSHRSLFLDSEAKIFALLQAIFDQTFQFIGVLNLDGTVVKVNKTAMSLVEVQESQVIGKPFWETPWWSKSKREQNRLRKAVGEASRGHLVRFETKNIGANGQRIAIDFSLKPVTDEAGNIVLLIAEGRDITELKGAMEDLRKREAELKAQSRDLEEANIALKVILEQMRDKEKRDKEDILSNVRHSVLPYLNRLKKTNLTKSQQILANTVEANLANLTSPLVSKLSSTFLNLTPMEIRIAGLVKQGLTNKEIAEALGTSVNTVSSHRYRIRSNLGLKNKGANLRSYLLSLEN